MKSVESSECLSSRVLVVDGFPGTGCGGVFDRSEDALGRHGGCPGHFLGLIEGIDHRLLDDHVLTGLEGGVSIAPSVGMDLTHEGIPNERDSQ